MDVQGFSDILDKCKNSTGMSYEKIHQKSGVGVPAIVKCVCYNGSYLLITAVMILRAMGYYLYIGGVLINSDEDIAKLFHDKRMEWMDSYNAFASRLGIEYGTSIKKIEEGASTNIKNVLSFCNVFSVELQVKKKKEAKEDEHLFQG